MSTAVRIAFLTDPGPARKGMQDIASSAEQAGDRTERAFNGAARAVDGIDTSKAKRSMDDLGESTDETATKTGTFASALGAFSGGLEAVGLEKYAGLLGGAAVGVDVFSNASDVATLALQSKYVASVKDKAATVAATVAEKGRAVATKAGAAAQWLLNAAMSANPIGLVVLAIAALVTGLVIAYKKSETFRNIVNGAFGAVKVAVGAVVDFFKELPGKIGAAVSKVAGAVSSAFTATVAFFKSAPGKVTGALGNLGSLLYTRGSALLGGLLKGASSVLGRIGSFFKELPGKALKGVGNVASTLYSKGSALVGGILTGAASVLVRFGRFYASLPGKALSAIGAVASTLYSKGSGLVGGLVTGAGSVVSRVGTFFGGIPGKALSALGDVGSKLYSAGSDLVGGMISGVKSRISELVSSVSGAVGSIPGVAKKLLGINSPSKVLRWIAQMAVRGLEVGLSRTAGVERAAQRLAAATTGGFGSVDLSPSVALAGAVGGRTALAGDGVTVNVYALSDGPEVGRRVVDVIRDYERFNGAGWRS